MSNDFMDGYHNLWTKQDAFNSDEVETQAVGLIRMASVHKAGIDAAVTASRAIGLPAYMQSAILYYGLPRRSPGYKKLPKKTKETKPTKKQARALEKIRAKHNVNDIHAAQIVKLMKKLKKRIGE